MIKNIAEILVDVGWFDTKRKAVGAIKRGEISVNSIRVANPTALLVIVERVLISQVVNEKLRRLRWITATNEPQTVTMEVQCQ